MKHWLLLAGALAASACSKTSSLDGFKGIAFGQTRAQVEALGFECSDIGECRGGEAGEQVAALTFAQISAADASSGEVVFKRCTSCHTISKGEPNGIGPNLWNTYGGPIASVSGSFASSDALQQKRGIWTTDTLNAFLANPKAFAPGTKMTFSGVADPVKRANLIAYLNKMGDRPGPLRAIQASKPAGHQQAPITLFGKAAEVRPNLVKGKVATIDVTVALTADEVTSLLKDQYGEPKSYEYEGFLGGRVRVTYWLFGNGSSIMLRETLSPGTGGLTGVDASLHQLGIDPTDYILSHSTVTYADATETKKVLERVSGNVVDPKDI